MRVRVRDWDATTDVGVRMMQCNEQRVPPLETSEEQEGNGFSP